MTTDNLSQPFDSNVYQRLLKNSAQNYRRAGYSVIPVYGYHNPVMAKRAVVPWKPYQQSYPTLKQLNKWFSFKERVGGVAIITGHLSRLIVLDFDDAEQARDFARRYPELTHTKIVTSASRKLPHYYYRIPHSVMVSTKHGNGVDLLGEGSYVVTAPTQLSTGHYEEDNTEPLYLTQDQIQLLTCYIDETCKNAQEAEGTILTTTTTVNNNHLSKLQLNHMYEKLIQQLGGRNNALYETARALCNASVTLKEALHRLVDIHVMTPPISHHLPETPNQRTTEARRTILSAYKRPARTTTSRKQYGIPNTLREYLLQKNKTAAAQVLDAFFLCGGIPQHTTTYKTLRNNTNLTSWTLRTGITQLIQLNLVKRHKTTPPQCILLGGQNQQKRGRPEILYEIIDTKAMCSVLGIAYSYLSDAVTWSDIKSAKMYRIARIREFLKRRPGQYVRDYLARIVGVTARTTRRYTRVLGFNCQPMYERIEITDNSAKYLESYVKYVDFCRDKPVNSGANGVFLVINSRRYPPLAKIACSALKRRERVWLYQQQPNSYSHQEGLPLQQIVHSSILTFNMYVQQINTLKYGV